MKTQEHCLLYLGNVEESETQTYPHSVTCTEHTMDASRSGTFHTTGLVNQRRQHRPYVGYSME